MCLSHPPPVICFSFLFSSPMLTLPVFPFFCPAHPPPTSVHLQYESQVSGHQPPRPEPTLCPQRPTGPGQPASPHRPTPVFSPLGTSSGPNHPPPGAQRGGPTGAERHHQDKPGLVNQAPQQRSESPSVDQNPQRLKRFFPPLRPVHCPLVEAAPTTLTQTHTHSHSVCTDV